MKVTFKRVKKINEFIDAIRLRVDVFIKEQGFQPGWEPDEEDKISLQYIALARGKIICTARARKTGAREIKIERMATAKAYRRKNIGRGLVAFIIKDCNKQKPKRIWVQSQVRSQPFYEKCGFVTVSKPLNLWGCPHIEMEYKQ